MILRGLALVGATIAYWVCALFVLGGLLIGDCFENQACYAAKRKVLNIGLPGSVVIYIALIGFIAWKLFRARSKPRGL
ncbi:MAG: hypothetical protein QOJ91_3090 [Sphingomonadales bacterium]|nr:hypothetical protein [Sphingomonadales bacterium]